MKKTLKEFYNIDALIFVKISPSLLRVKSENQDYALKFVESNELNTIYSHISMLHLDSFLLPFQNINQQYVTPYEEKYFTLSYWYDDELTAARDIRLKFYFNKLAELHHRSVYTIRVNDGYFKETIEYVFQQLNKVSQILEERLYAIERSDYRSPVEWLLLLNNQRFYLAIEQSRKHIEKFADLVKEKNSIRLSLVYQNFDSSHIIVKSNKIIATHNMNFAPPVYDLKHLHDVSYQNLIDLSGICEEYLHYFKLYDYEIELFLALIMIPNINIDGEDEVTKIVNLTRSLHHLRCSQEIAKSFLEFKN